MPASPASRCSAGGLGRAGSLPGSYRRAHGFRRISLRRAISDGERSAMTEREAYARLGWSSKGDLLKFVLPESGSTDTGWCITKCVTCMWSGMSLPHLLDQGCPSCGKPWTEIIR